MSKKIGVILSYVLMIFEVLSTLLLTPFIIRTIGQAEYGVFKLASAITAYLLLLDLGVGNSIIRYISKYKINNNKEKEEQFFGIVSIFYLIVGIICFFIGLIIIKFFPEIFAEGLSSSEILLSQKLLFITIINCAVTLSTTCYNNILLAYEKYFISRTISIIQIIIRMLLTYFSLLEGYGSVGIVAVNLLITILGRMYMIIYVFTKLKIFPRLKGIKKQFIKEMIGYTSLIFLQMIATQLNSNVDQILIGSLVASSSTIIGIYSIGTQIVQYYQTIGSAIPNVLMPGVVKMVETNFSKQNITNEMIRIGRIIFMLLVLIFGCFVVNGKSFIMLWAGESNINAYYVTTILMFSYMFILTESLGSQILWAMNEHKEQTYLKLAIVILNIFLTIILIKWNPLIGATLGTFISLMLGDIGVMNIIYKKKFNLDLKYYYKNLFKGIVPSTLISIIVGIIVKIFLNNITWLSFIIDILIMIIVYGLLMIIFGFNAYEKKLLKTIFKCRREDYEKSKIFSTL